MGSSAWNFREENINTIINKKRDCSVYAENRRKKFDNLSQVEQLTRWVLGHERR